MPRQVILQCSFCGKEVEKVIAKVYLAPLLPGSTQTSYSSRYSHHGDACSECADRLSGMMAKREPRSENGKPGHSKKRKKTVR